jgi:hypothetical protein
MKLPEGVRLPALTADAEWTLQSEGQVSVHQPWRAGLSKALSGVLRQGDAPDYAE